MYASVDLIKFIVCWIKSSLPISFSRRTKDSHSSNISSVAQALANASVQLNARLLYYGHDNAHVNSLPHVESTKSITRSRNIVFLCHEQQADPTWI